MRKTAQVLFRFGMLLCVLCVTGTLTAQVTIVLDRIPATTPPDDTIFIAGSFNDWDTRNPDYMLHRQLDGRYAITLPLTRGSIEYKFTRGEWLRVESDAQNSPRPNRYFEYQGAAHTIYAEIENWQDLGGARPVSLFSFFIFAAALQGILLIVLILRIKTNYRPANTVLASFVGIISMALFGRVLYSQVMLIFQSHLTLLNNSLLFLPGPIFYFYVCRLTRPDFALRNWRLVGHLCLPVLLLLFAIIRLSGSALFTFGYSPSQELAVESQIINLLALLATAGYLIAAWRTYQRAGDSAYLVRNKHARLYMRVLLGFYCFCLFLWASTWAQQLNGSLHPALQSYEAVWLGLSCTVYVIGFFALKNPELFKTPKIKPVPGTIDGLDQLKADLRRLMHDEKLYCDPNLTIADLADKMDTKSHILSRLFNDHFKKKFRDFVNEYRVEEFIKLAHTEAYKDYTYLALAHEVGFNSKTTFNTAFKKATNCSPREYFKAGSHKAPAHKER